MSPGGRHHDIILLAGILTEGMLTSNGYPYDPLKHFTIEESAVLMPYDDASAQMAPSGTSV